MKILKKLTMIGLSLTMIFSILYSNIEIVRALVSANYTTKQYSSGYQSDKGTDIVRLRVHSQDGGIPHYNPSNPTGRRWGQWAFCVEHGQKVTNGESTGDFSSLSSIYKNVARIAYLGFYSHEEWLPGITNESLNLGYARTQMLIWQILGQAKQNYQVDSGYNAWKAGIMDQYNKWDTKPSFDNTSITLDVGKSTTLTDTHGVLQYYNSFQYSQDGVSFSHTKGSHSMQVKVLDNCQTKEVVIDKNVAKKAGMSKYENSQKTTVALFIHDTDGEQDKVCTPGYNDPQYLSLKITIRLNGNLQLSKKDNKGHDVANTKFMVSYNSDMSSPIGTFQTDNTGKVMVSNLKPQTVYIQEIEVPNHLILDTTIHSVQIKANETTSYTATNQWKQGYLQVVKKDVETGKIVKKAGVKFDVYNVQHVKIDTIMTNQDGYAKTKLLDYGTYYVKETLAPEGYLIQVEVSEDIGIVENGKTYEIVVSNQQVKGKIEVVKEDSVTKEAQGEATLKGAVYGVFARENIMDPSHDGKVLFKAGTKIQEKQTDVHGCMTFENLYLGRYYVQEVEASPGYTLDATKYPVDLLYIDQHESVVTKKCVVKERVQSQAFQIIKVSSDENGEAELLAGAEFTIKSQKDIAKYGSFEKAPIAKNAKGKTAALLITDSKGYAVSERLPYGTYVVRETKAPDDKYPVDDFKITISKDSSEPQVWRVFNDTSFQSILEIAKIDKATQKVVRIQGAEFKIKNLDTGKYFGYWQWSPLPHYVESWITDKNGKVMTAEKLQAGHYQLEEIKSPNGYLLSQNPIPFTISSQGAYETLPDGKTPFMTVEFKDESVKGKISIEKQGEVLTDYRDGQFIYEKHGLTNAEYEIIAKENIMDPSCDGTILYPKGSIVQRLKTNVSGKVESKALPLGEYAVREVKAPNGFVIDSKVKDVTLSYENQNVEIVYEDVSFINDRQKVSLSVVKKDKDKDICLSGAEFGLYTSQDILNYQGKLLIKKGELIEKSISDDNGQVRFKSDLPLSIYEVKEVKAPVGYASSHETLTLEASYQGQDVREIFLERVFKNEITKIEISKQDISTQKELPGASMVVYEKDNPAHVLDSWISTKKPHMIQGLEVQKTYVLKEIASPYGYAITKDIEFTIQDTGDVQKVKMYDDIVFGQLKWSKKGDRFDRTVIGQTEFGKTISPVWEDGYLLGSEITIYAAEDISIGDIVYKKDHKIQTLESDLDIVTSQKLPVGKYYYKETKVPHGYVGDDEKHYFEIKDNQSSDIQIVTTSLHNKRAKVNMSMKKILEKQNIFENTDAYQDIVFGIFAREDIYDYKGQVAIENGSLIYTSGINKDGTLTLTDTFDLPNGVYYLKELATNGQYLLDDTEYDFEIGYHGPDVSHYTVSIGHEGTITNDLMRGSVQLFKKAHVRLVKDGKFVDEQQFLKDAQYAIATDRDMKNIVQTALTNDEGYICFDNLEKGTYYIKEIKAPRGYEFNERVYCVKITEHGQVLTIEAYDEQILTDIQVHKVDEQTGDPIVYKDFELTLYNDPLCRQPLEKATAHQSTGVATFTSLPQGTYYIKETKAPLGYQLSKEVKKIVIDEKLNGYGYIHSFPYSNKKTPLIVRTGDYTRWATAFASMVISIFGIYALTKKKKKVS